MANKFNINVSLKMDNSAAVSYINNMGGIRSPSLDELAVSIWGLKHNPVQTTGEIKPFLI